MRSALTLIALSYATAATVAQTDLPTSEVRVEKLFDARLLDTRRIELYPTLPALDTTLVTQRYEVVAVDADIDYDPPRIRPLAIKVDEPAEPYRGFARLGGGLPAAGIGDLGYLMQNDRYTLRADGHAYGFRGNYNEDQRYAEVNARVGGTYYAGEEVAVDLDVDYDRRGYRYYGFAGAVADTSAVIAPDDVKQHFGVFGVRAGIRNAKPTAPGIDYAVHIGTDFLADNFATKERHVALNGLGRKDLSEEWYAEVGVDLRFVRLDGLAEDKLNIFSFSPVVGAHFDKLGVRLGAVIANENDEFALYPNLEASYAIRPTLVFVAGADGGPRGQTLLSMSRYIPYVTSQPELRIAQEYRFFAGVQTRIRGIDLKATGSYKAINDLALFVTDDTAPYRFVPRYDSANVFGFQVEASAPLAARLSGQLQLESRIFDLETAPDPFLLPSFDASLRVRYEVIEERLGVSGFLLAQNALPVAAPLDAPRAPETSALFDLSAHGDYQISERFGAFAQLNNLLNNRRRQFPFYPILGTNVLVGVTARF